MCSIIISSISNQYLKHSLENVGIWRLHNYLQFTCNRSEGVQQDAKALLFMLVMVMITMMSLMAIVLLDGGHHIGRDHDDDQRKSLEFNFLESV